MTKALGCIDASHLLAGTDLQDYHSPKGAPINMRVLDGVTCYIVYIQMWGKANKSIMSD